MFSFGYNGEGLAPYAGFISVCVLSGKICPSIYPGDYHPRDRT